MITGRQIRAARALLGIDAIDLAQEAGLNRDTITALEQGTRQPHRASMEKITNILAQRGVEFTDNQGVRFKSDDIEVFKGRERFHDFTEFVFEHLNRFGGAVCISAVDEKLFRQYRKDFDLYRKRMAALVARGDVTVRILATESTFASSWAQIQMAAETKHPAHVILRLRRLSCAYLFRA